VGTTLKRTTIFLTEDQHETLRRIAFDRRTSMSKLIRDAALKIMEDEEDTITWKQYQHTRVKRESQNKL